MDNPPTDKTFDFSPPIDSRYLIELYAGDYIMIGETFTDVLQEYDEFVRQISAGYAGGDRTALKGAVHKIKPLFGFVGLLTLQADCQEFENTCQDADPAMLAASFRRLEEKLLNIRKLIETEKVRLEGFNNS